MTTRDELIKAAAAAIWGVSGCCPDCLPDAMDRGSVRAEATAALDAILPLLAADLREAHYRSSVCTCHPDSYMCAVCGLEWPCPTELAVRRWLGE